MTSGLVTFDAVAEFADAYIADPSRSFTPEQMLGYVRDSSCSSRQEPSPLLQHQHTFCSAWW